MHGGLLSTRTPGRASTRCAMAVALLLLGLLVGGCANASAGMESVAYVMPAFRLQGEVVAGFAAFTNHLSYLPHSGSVLSELADELAGYVSTPGSLHFPVDQPLPRPLGERRIEARLRRLRQRGASPSASASPAT